MLCREQSVQELLVPHAAAILLYCLLCFKRICLHLVDMLSSAHHRGGGRLNSLLFVERALIAS